jgi:pimeloyl-ACP methyl ester carboxylesterase
MNTMTLRASQTQIAYADQGTGPGLVLLHAFPLDSTMWALQIGALADRFRVIAPDLPGLGKSAPSAGLTIDSIADAVAELLDHLGMNERVILGGLSMGGYAVLAFARLYPQRVRALVLADTKAEPDDEAGRAARDRTIQLAINRGPAAVVDEAIPRLLAPDTVARRLQVVHFVRETAARQQVDGIVAALKALRDRPDARPGLSHISFPTLVVVGDHDVITPPDRARDLVSAIPNARLVTVPDAGHLSNLENPIAFNSAVREFLNGLPAEGGVSRTV